MDFDLARALTMKDRGASLRVIAASLGVGVATVHRLLKGVPEGSLERGLQVAEMTTLG